MHTTPRHHRYGDGVQATKALWDPALWSAWDVPPTAMLPGNNTIAVSTSSGTTESMAVMKLELSLPVGS